MPSTTPSSTLSSSLGKFELKDHEMRCEANTGQLVVENSLKDTIKGDTMTNSQVMNLDARSKNSMGSPMTWEPSRTKNSKANTGHSVIKNLVTDIDLEAKEECNILSVCSISFTEKVNKRLRAMLNRLPRDEMEGIDKKFSHIGRFMISSVQAAIGKEYSENLRSIRNTDQKPTVQKIVLRDSNMDSRTKFGDLASVRIEFGISNWEKLFLAKDVVVIKAHEGEGLCILWLCIVRWKMSEYPQSDNDWENTLLWFKITEQYKKLDGIDGEPLEFEFRIYPGHTTLQIIQDIKALMRKLTCEPEQFKGRIIVMSMFSDNVSEIGMTNVLVWQIQQLLVVMLRGSPWDIGHFSDLVQKQSRLQQTPLSLEENGTGLRLMMESLSTSGHPIFRATSALDPGQLKSKGNGKLSCG